VIFCVQSIAGLEESTDVPGMRFAQGNLGVPEFLISDPGERFKTSCGQS